MESYSAVTVAQRYINLAAEAKKTLTPMQLIKLVYLAHGWMLAAIGRPLLEESVEAWEYGPVLRSLYEKVKTFRSQPVVGPLCEDCDDIDSEADDIINQVFGLYGHLDGISLSSLTHQADTPWDVTWRSLGKNGVISNDLIESHFRGLLAA